ncbi:hypothetical protein SEMRO_296_G110810.1 [Seminavis robusta]|uniref:Uncharacterized protein n=1 Tax=Seminavis robusta TaxID=568900 RepID=A0A9N8H9X8_9STRA|nr:hypothetical protein SEMRO_296_G110810.1 [Seminavis robusta]|eukprot:Sro296_g110810.1 n/a (90) ;mRNA; f:79081-79350
MGDNEKEAEKPASAIQQGGTLATAKAAGSSKNETGIPGNQGDKASEHNLSEFMGGGTKENEQKLTEKPAEEGAKKPAAVKQQQQHLCLV